MNSKDRSAELLESAIEILNRDGSVVVIQPWRDILKPLVLVKAGRRSTDPYIPTAIPDGFPMPRALADQKQSEYDAARRRLSQRGIEKPTHTPGWPEFRRSGTPLIDKSRAAVVESEHVNQGVTTGEPKVSEVTMTPEEKQAAKEAAVKAKIEAKAQKLAEQQAKKEAREAAKAQKLAEKEAKAKAREEAKAERAESASAGGMASLADRIKSGAYVKGANGQLRSNDDVAIALESVAPKRTVELLLNVLGLSENPYENLNYGQQSMNLRNRLRGAVRNGKVSLDTLREIRDSGGYVNAA